MVFASLTFLCIFLPLHLILYYATDNKVYRNLLLTAFSLTFYAWGEPVWILLLLFSATIDYANGLWIERFRKTAWATVGLWSSILINIGLLVAFKYNGFIYENINLLLGLNLKAPTYNLPVGISFYTFQTISYTIDVYRGDVKAQRNFPKFLMFVSLFHHEIDERKEDPYDISQGMLRFCIGLFKKVFIANVAGELAVTYLGTTENPMDLASLSIGEAWFGILMFSIQIYFDFSGYSDMAIGLGRMFGFHYLENFNYPYISKTATEFWRRWHISLGTFFRDYIYIPLGGNRKGKVRAYFNLFVVWFLTGLWHGASWNFVLWGLYFGILILIERLFLKKIFKYLPAIFGHLYLLIAVVFGWALFYFENFEQLLAFLKIMVFACENDWWSFKLTFVLKEHLYWLILTVLLCLPIYPIFAKWLEGVVRLKAQPIYWLIVIGIQVVFLFLSIALLVGDSYNPFIYYRF